MSKHLKTWLPSSAALKLIKLNGLSDQMVENSLNYLKTKTELDNIDDIDGYDNWDAFFIMFAIKANKNALPNSAENPDG